MNKPLVSIIVPVYNTAEYVEECIQSILSQSYKNIELILVNDGSTDESELICRKFEIDSRFRYYNQRHSDVTAARRKGVQEARGEWITFVDSDDYYTSNNAIQLLVEESDGVDIVCGGFGKGYVDKSVLPDYLTCGQYLKMQYARELSAGPWAKLFRRSLFSERTLDETKSITRAQDYLMNLQLAVDNKKTVRVFKHPIYFVRERNTSKRHSFILSFDYIVMLTNLADAIVCGRLPGESLLNAQLNQRLYFFYETITTNGFKSNALHPYVQDINRRMNEAGVWRPMDRWLLSVSSPWAVKTVWNLRKVTRRLAHPSMIPGDIKRLLNR